MKAPKRAAATPTTKPPVVTLRPRALPVLPNVLEEPVLEEPAAVVVADELPDPELVLREREVPQAWL